MSDLACIWPGSKCENRTRPKGKKTKKQLVAGQIQPRIANTTRMPRWGPTGYVPRFVSSFPFRASQRPRKLTCTLVSSASRAQTHQVGGCSRVTVCVCIVQENTQRSSYFPAINPAPSLDFIFFFARSVGYRQRYWAPLHIPHGLANRTKTASFLSAAAISTP